MIKIIFDYFASLLGLIILSPIILLIVLISFFAQGQPIFFIHERLGKDGIPFMMIKLRTMSSGPSISARDDITRITKWGRFLRITSMDELPVLLNVLKGEMSIVGPRPLPTKYLNRFSSFQKKRMNVKPGITGLAQINGRNHLSWDERFKYDIDYLNKKSFFFDLKIIFKTFLLVIIHKNVDGKTQEIMPEFFGSDLNDIENPD